MPPPPAPDPKATLVRWYGVFAAMMLTLAACSPHGEAELVPNDSVQSDLATLAATTFATFLDAAPGVEDCVGTVHLAATTELADLATYTPATATITLRVPATAPNLRDSLVHELGHHVELACTSQTDLRNDFLAAQGFAMSQQWFEGSSWEHTPSEQFAEAVVLVVLGRRTRNLGRLHLDPTATALVAAWLDT